MRRLSVWILLPAALLAQMDRGTITGVVADSTGSVVPSVQISVRHEATGSESTTISSPAGTYTLALLPIGSYTLTARLPGFKSYVRNQVPVQVGQTTRVDIALEVGGVEERVTVTAEAPLLNTDTSDVGIVVNSEKFLDLPLTLGGDIRNASAFIFLSPGVSGNTWEKHIGGGGAFSDAVYYDGAALSGPTPNNDGQYNPSVDAIAEFKLITNDYAAEYGHALAGVTSFTLKSGTNSFHGSLFEFFRNEKLDARGFFPLVKAPTRQNEFGGTVGGPIRKNQTFFFVSIDTFRRRQGFTRPLVTAALPEFLRGDFRRWTTEIYDPATTMPDGRGGFMRQPFPNRMIPESRFSSISRNIAALYPAPTYPDRLTNNYLATLAQPMQDAHNWTAKVDHQLNAAHKLFGTFIYTDRPAIKGSASLEGPLLSNNRQDLSSRFLRVGEDWTIGPTTINHFVASFDRVVDKNVALTHGQGWRDKLGLRGVQGDFFPRVEFSQGYVQLGHTTNYKTTGTSFGFLDTLSLIRGKHSIKVGVEYLRHRDNDNALSNTGGTFTFSNLETAVPGDSRTGNAIASFLLGAVDNSSARFYANETGVRWSYFASFIQDDYKLTSKLTLNLGLRWELQTPFSDVLDRLSYMDPSLPNPGAGNRLGAYTFLGGNGFSRLAEVKWKDFGPRFGFAYNVAKDWVVRGGYGIFYWSLNRGGIGIPADGFNVNASFASADVGITPAFNWDHGFPQNFTKPPILTPTVQNGLNATVSLRSRGGVWPYSQQWNLTVERQIGTTTAIRAGYVGVKGSRLHAQDATNWNQVDPRYLSLGSLLNAHITSPPAQAAGLTSPFPGFTELWGSRATVAQALRPFPQYNSVGQAAASYGNSNYHSLQVHAQKRMAQGFDFTVAYTFSKMIDDTRQFSTGVGQQNYYDRRSERSISVFDQPHILAISYVYELPFGPGKRYGSNLGSIAGRLVGGWNVSGIHRYTSGFPQSLSVINTLPIFNGTLRPNSVPGVAQRGQEGPGGFDPNRDRWINPAAFAAPAAFTFGNTSRYIGTLRGPASLAESFAILKDTRITEQINLQFRTEISNPFNRTVFSDPQTNLSNVNFGQIVSQSNTPRVIQLGLKLIW